MSDSDSDSDSNSDGDSSFDYDNLICDICKISVDDNYEPPLVGDELIDTWEENYDIALSFPNWEYRRYNHCCKCKLILPYLPCVFQYDHCCKCKKVYLDHYDSGSFNSTYAHCKICHDTYCDFVSWYYTIPWDHYYVKWHCDTCHKSLSVNCPVCRNDKYEIEKRGNIHTCKLMHKCSTK
jgi:hypothetical protein